MRYISTRGRAPAVTFAEAILAGLAPDGGLYVPEAWPALGPAPAGAPYAQTAAEVVAALGADPAVAASAAQAAYAPPLWPKAVTPLVQIDADAWLMELFHGPSLSFKDVAMQLIARLYQAALSERGQRLTVVCATSGDTGGAAVEALQHVDLIDLFVLLPRGRVSQVQRRFMTASGAANVFALEVEGDFDACQALVKGLFADRAFAARARLSGVNSINWARIAAQSVYYRQAAAALGLAPVTFAVPTGNFGDAFSGFVAKRLGAPVGPIAIATNANAILHVALETGVYARASESRETLSPAMDIQVASNFERLVFEALDRDADRVAQLYAQFAQTGAFDIPAEALAFMRAHFTSAAVNDAETIAQMQRSWRDARALVCPHTAVALAAGEGGQSRRVTLATAHPAKFPETVERALGRAPALPDACADLFHRPERCTPLPADLAAVRAFIQEKSRAWE